MSQPSHLVNWQTGLGASVLVVGFCYLILTANSPNQVPTQTTSVDLQPAAIRTIKSPSMVMFEEHVAPIIANHCLECHDPATQEGGLDLSTESATRRGGDSGPAIVPGQPEVSQLWHSIESDEMPFERPLLSLDEKKHIAEWIQSGAEWSVSAIDPIVFSGHTPDSEAFVRRLTVEEYIAAIDGALGVDISDLARELLPPDLRADGFRNTAYNLQVDLKHVQAYAQLAEEIATQVNAPLFSRWFTESTEVTPENLRELISRMGQYVLRGPLTAPEIESYVHIGETVVEMDGDMAEVTRNLLQAMVQSPRFLYRIENQRGDESQEAATSFEVASRLSFLIWGSTPDTTLFDLAKNDQLQDPAIVARQVRRMLKNPRARDQSLEFISQWLDLDRLEHLRPDPNRFPQWDAELASDMRLETLRFFEEVVWEQKRPLADLFNARFTFVTPELAKLYGLELQINSDDESEQNQPVKYDLSDIPHRGGILTQASILTIGGDDSSMVARGLFVMHDLLRGIVNDPPPCVDTTPVASGPGLTQRKIALERITDSNCGGCHSRFEPLAFGLERFDAIGRYHPQDHHGNELREDGEILFPLAAESIPYNSSRELMDLLADSDRVKQTITWKVCQFAMGRPLTARDAATIEQIHQVSQSNGGTWPSLMKAIATSDLILKTRTVEEPEH